jgi:hypothetical protein
MIKKLILMIALSFPGLAYGENPSASFSDQVVSAGSDPIACDFGVPYSGSIPAAAQAAGFTHCAANYDFTTAAFSNPHVWLGSGNGACNGTNPVLYDVDSTGNGTGYAPCARFQMVNDTSNGGPSQVLQVGFLTNDRYSATSLATSSNIGYPNSPGLNFYNGFYAEETFRLDASLIANTSCPAGGTQPCLYFSWWTFPIACPDCDSSMEFDFIEAYGTQANGGYAVAGGATANGGVGNIPSSQVNSLTTSYNTLGVLTTVTNGGDLNYGTCWIFNNTTLSCNDATVSQADITNAYFHMLVAEVGPQASFLSPRVNQYAYIARLTIWSCPTYATAPCYSSSVVNYSNVN